MLSLPYPTRVHCAGASARVVAELQFEIPKMYKHHKHDSLDVAVDFWRFSPRADEPGGCAAQVPSANLGGKGAEGKGGRGGAKGGGGRGACGGKGGKGSSAGGACGFKSNHEARAHAKARVEHFGGGGKTERSNRRGDGYRATKPG